MNDWKLTTAAGAALVLAAQAAAQSSDADERERMLEMREAERQRVLELREAEQNMAVAEQRQRVLEMREAERKMAEAERELELAARKIAELSTRRLPQVVANERMFVELMGRPRLGVTIGNDERDGPVEGVTIIGVTPGSAAADAGLQAGDVLTAVNDESLSAASAAEANRRLLDFMRGVESGDELDVEYLRNGDIRKLTLEPRVSPDNVFAWAPNVRVHSDPNVRVTPNITRSLRFSSAWTADTWGDMELVELSEGLGRYFGTDSGLLVVKAPSGDALQLEDGDVIKSIDGREPTSVGHALRILGSYQAGEAMELKILRDKRRQTLKIQMPDERQGLLFDNVTPLPPHPPLAPTADTAVVID